MNKATLVSKLAALLAASWAAGMALPALATEVGVSVRISQPGVYGRIDIGNYPQPVVVPRPIIIMQPAVVVARPEPVYMWVPPGHRKDWRRYCGGYGACGVPVYFVQDDWYDQKVMKGKGHGNAQGNGHGKGKGHDN
jgi:hypothetical protein